MKKYVLTLVFALFALVLQAQTLDMNKLKGLEPRSIGPAGMSGRITAIDVVRKQPHIIYAGAASGGLWRSSNGGIDWEPLFDSVRVQGIGAVAVQQSNPDVIWVGTGEGNPRNSQTSGYGLYKSIDGGKTWQLTGLEQTRVIHRIIIDPTNPDVVYVGAQGYAWDDSEHRGVYKTTDGGKTWNKILYNNARTGVGDMVMDPSNPNKLVVAMWEFRRWPWFFKSGGEGSGLYITFDGGQTWQKRGEKEGLPKGELGRIGLAIAPNNPDVIYALVESKKNALYGSKDGGFTWKKINDGNDIGDRPFYYADIFVDPKNELRLFTLYSRVAMSEDGGKSFDVILPYYGVHPDHHAWYIHPDDPNFMIDGNDGGLNISRDGGKTWRFIENLPLAQFYHIDYDMEWPYNVYGGMQDNGSWRGPAYVWQSGGIRNHNWKEVLFGDGFDVSPDPENARYGYAMSQGGNIARYDFETGYSVSLKPEHPEGADLRYNWNAPLEQDPLDKATIYYGSQFVHKSNDRGASWSIISPDLTSNNPDKQTYSKSGGLTYDVTNAENHTTLTAIAASPKKQGILWVGSDDGRLHVTRDSGQNWDDITKRLKNMPEGAWIPQITASEFNVDEAFIVVNDYRRGDWTPFLYHAKDYGKKIERLVDSDDVFGYVLSFIQDPIEPKLMFLGTEFGLYMSIDAGKNWTHWTNDYPSGVSTIDLKIHPREHDLIIGTFGRAAYILDDIRPLRALAAKGASLLDKELTVFQPHTAVLAQYSRPFGSRFDADGMFNGENRSYGAMITYSVRQGKADRDKEKSSEQNDGEKEETDGEKDTFDRVKVEIYSADGNKIRTLSHTPETGINRMFWGLREKGERYPTQAKPTRPNAPEPGGASVLPGTYKIKLSYGAATDSTTVTVVDDPRFDTPRNVLEQNLALQREMQHVAAGLTTWMDKIRDAESAVALIEKQMPKSELTDAQKTFKKQTKTVKDSLKAINEYISGKADVQGIFRDPNIVSAKLRGGMFAASGLRGPVNQTAMRRMDEAKKAVIQAENRIKAFMNGSWADYKKAYETAGLSPFKE